MLNSASIKQYLANEFDLIGICPAVTPTGLSNFYSWLDAGYAGEMDYLPARKEAYSHPRYVMDGVRSIIMLGLKYATRDDASENPDTDHRLLPESHVAGQVSRYARSGVDYHDIVHKKLKKAKQHFEALAPEARFRGVVDTAPLLEREFAQLAGLGWQGKNTMLISKTDGSWFFLAALLTDLDLEYDQPFESSHCGTCRACMDACPTDAFVSPFVLDGTRCISYFTIESQEMPPREFRNAIGDWVFGCDICQQVCPWNRKDQAYLTNDSDVAPVFLETMSGLSLDELHELMRIDDSGFRTRFRNTPFWRSKRRGILRNVAIVLGNQADRESIPILVEGLTDSDPIVRAACAWALGQVNGAESHFALRNRAEVEQDRLVVAEIASALEESHQR